MIQSEPEIETLSKFLNSFNKESDRGAVLLAASIIDEWLSEIIESYLKNTHISKELLFGFNAPLGNFSSRIKIAFSLSLIEEREYEEIEIIRKIRNEFGHNWYGVDFNSKKIHSECNKLKWYGPTDIPKENFTNRNKFNFTIVALLTDLLWRKRLVKKQQILDKIWPNKNRKS